MHNTDVKPNGSTTYSIHYLDFRKDSDDGPPSDMPHFTFGFILLPKTVRHTEHSVPYTQQFWPNPFMDPFRYAGVSLAFVVLHSSNACSLAGYQVLARQAVSLHCKRAPREKKKPRCPRIPTNLPLVSIQPICRDKQPIPRLCFI